MTIMETWDVIGASDLFSDDVKQQKLRSSSALTGLSALEVLRFYCSILLFSSETLFGEAGS